MTMLLLVASLICAVIAALVGFDVVIHDAAHAFGWLAAAVALWLLAQIVGEY